MFGRKKKLPSVDTTAGAVARVEGNGKDAYLFDTHLVIRQFKNARKTKHHFDKTIRLTSINSVQLRTPGKLGLGYLQLAVSGENPPTGRKQLDTILDENTIPFIKKQTKDFERFAALINSRIVDIT